MHNDEVIATPQNKLVLPVKAIEQEYKWNCGTTALRIALKYQFGIRLTGNDMILLCGATDSGTDEYNFIKGLNALGFKYRQTNHGTFNQLKACLQEGQAPIVHLVMPDGGGHYMVFSGYDDDTESVWLADPATGKVLKYGSSFFLGVWKVEERETQTKWFIVITGHVGDKIDSMIQTLKRIQKKVRNTRK